MEWLRHEIELPSEPSTPGTIQVTPGGDPIILGPDGPTIGGYPKIGFVVQADLGRGGQLRPGDPVRLEEVTLAEARGLTRL
jgi:allophanate hydrolase subunit 2